MLMARYAWISGSITLCATVTNESINRTEAAYLTVADESVPQAAEAAHIAGSSVFEKPDSVVITSEPDDMKEFTSATLIIAIAAHPPSVTYSGASSQNTVSTAQIMATAIMLKARFITPPSPPETASVNALPSLDSPSCGDCAVSPTSSSA